MYCQTCGTEIQPGLNFCNRCGAPANGPGAPAHELVPVDVSGAVRWISLTVLLTMILGIGVLFIAVAGLASSGALRGGAVPFITFVGLLAILFTELSLIRVLSRLLSAAKGRAALAPAGKPGARELRQPAPQYVVPPPPHSYRGPVPSVTEHTTRTFDAAPGRGA